MPTIVNYIKNLDAFEPEHIDLMASAYEHACKLLDNPSVAARQLAANRIISLTQRGERDVLKLAQAAVDAARTQ